ncbi:MAG: VWA domain-containing protein [Acidobacteriota bacterium]
MLRGITHRPRLLLTSALSLLAIAVPIATGRLSRAADDEQLSFRSGVSLVALNVTVTDGKAQYIPGLLPDDFAVYEDGVRQDLRFFASSDVPIDLGILIDCSASMRTTLQTAQEAAVGFVRVLRSQDRAAIIAFSKGTRVLQGLTGDKALLEAAIRSTTASHVTPLRDAIYIAIAEMRRQRLAYTEVRRQAIVVLSDGDDTASLLSFDDLLDIVRRAHVGLYTISLRPGWRPGWAQGSTPSDYEMHSLARETGGRVFFADDVNRLAGLYADVAEELAHQYSIGYVPRELDDSGFRRVLVRVVGRADAMVRTRTGYIAERRTAGAAIARRQP